MKILKLFTRLLIIFLLFSCGSKVKEEYASTFSAKVIAVKDGDTIDVLYDGKALRIRLAHIDCPELKKGQPFGKEAKLLTSTLCFGQSVQILNDRKYDRYHRLIALVINSRNENVNKELVKAGLAWHFRKYSSDTSYAILQEQARTAGLGLWKEKDPVPPWDWRKEPKINNKQATDS